MTAREIFTQMEHPRGPLDGRTLAYVKLNGNSAAELLTRRGCITRTLHYAVRVVLNGEYAQALNRAFISREEAEAYIEMLQEDFAFAH